MKSADIHINVYIGYYYALKHKISYMNICSGTKSAIKLIVYRIF